MDRSNTVFIGRKPVLNYVLACMTLFKSGHQEVSIKARGRSISRAVDVSEVSAKRFLEGSVAVKDIKIDSEEFTNKEGKNVRVSTIEITLKKVSK